MFKVGNVTRSIAATGSLLLSLAGCGESKSVRFAQERAARLADEAGLRQAADKLLGSCHTGKNLTKEAEVDSFAKCIEDGIEAAYPASCTKYYDTKDVPTSMGIMYPSECKMRFRVFVADGKWDLIDAGISAEEAADKARFKRAATEIYESCDKGHLDTAKGRKEFTNCVGAQYKFQFPGCIFYDTSVPFGMSDCERGFTREVVAGAKTYMQEAQ